MIVWYIKMLFVKRERERVTMLSPFFMFFSPRIWITGFWLAVATINMRNTFMCSFVFLYVCAIFVFLDILLVGGCFQNLFCKVVFKRLFDFYKSFFWKSLKNHLLWNTFVFKNNFSKIVLDNAFLELNQTELH